MSRHASRLLAIARWLTPSLVAACAAALVGGVIEGWGSSPAAFVATAGFVAIAAVPSITVLSIAIRALWAGWDPPTLLDVLIEPTGGAPGLAAWFSFLLLGGAAFGAIILRATWALGTRTSFAPLGIGFLEPLIFVSAGLVLFALSRPSVRGITALARVIDRRWPLRPRRIIVGVAIVVLVVGLVAWFLVDSWLGPIDGRPLVVLALAALAALASHAMSLRAFPIWRWCSLAIVVIAILAVGTAGFALRARPGLTLSIWGNRPIAGLVIDHVFDLDAVRDEVSTNNFRPVARPDAKHPDIVLITIDTVRSDQTPPYGGPADMPYLKEMASRGTVFEWAFSPSNVTRRSIPSMVIGLQPNRVHGRVVGWALRVDPRHTLVAERLRAGGYDTAGFMCCEGFWGRTARTGLARGLDHLEIERNGKELASLAKAWIQAREQLPDRKPLFLWMHILEPHNWHENRSDPSDPVARRKLYNESLAASDRMVAELASAFHGPQPILIVTADHGEALGDHGQPNHSTDLYDSQIHVPFVIAGPGVATARIDETVSLNDLTPTLVELAGFEPPHGADIDGRSIADLVTGRRPSNPDGGTAFAAMVRDRSNPGGVTALVAGRWKLIDTNGKLELYDTRRDPKELTDHASDEPAIRAKLEKLLEAHQLAGDESPFIE